LILVSLLFGRLVAEVLVVIGEEGDGEEEMSSWLEEQPIIDQAKIRMNLVLIATMEV